MRVTYSNRLQNRTTAECSNVIVYNDANQPIMIAVRAGNAIITSTAGDPDFNTVLRNLGIQQTVSVIDVVEKPIDSITITKI